nr:hypothetical protein [uncultured Draconibacterium sp.]
MKPLTKKIHNLITNEKLTPIIEKILENSQEFSFNESSIEEMVSDLDFIIDKISFLTTYEGFENISFTRRTNIHKNLHSLVNSLNSTEQFGFNLNKNTNIAGSIFNLVNSLKDHVDIALILTDKKGYYNYENDSKELIKLKKRYSKLVGDIENSEELLNLLETQKQKLNQLITDAENGDKRIIQLGDESESILRNINSNHDNSNSRLKNIQSIEQEIEKRKLTVNSFSSNIKEYKETVEDLINRTNALLEKEKEIDKLITQAETALNLKSAEGISAAFAQQYQKADDKKLYKGWLIGAMGSILIAVLLTVWIVTGLWIEEADSISSIIGRIVAVGIAVTSATFCAKQYTNQKRIAEDYAYKATLSKSIIAFTDEIKKRDDKQVTLYLNKVLEEIHQDPLRSRKDDDESLNDDNINRLQKILNLLAKGN